MSTPVSPDRPDRRSILRGAVAAGVGAAVWVAPDISTLGFTPAYALVCSAPGTYVATGGAVACPGGGPCAGVVALQGSVTLVLQGGGASSTTVSVSGSGPGCADGTRTLVFSGSGSAAPDLECVVDGIVVGGTDFGGGTTVPVIAQSEPGVCDGTWGITATCCPV